jgi:hypothetical protein
VTVTLLAEAVQGDAGLLARVTLFRRFFLTHEKKKCVAKIFCNLRKKFMPKYF